MASADLSRVTPTNQAQVAAYERTIQTLAYRMKPKALARALERLRDDADKASSATVIPIRGQWRDTGNRQAYGAALSDILDRLEKGV